ncbi:hypothetical protein [Phaeobacter inhibens]|uniref:hypothetical protein n=1 Tax=Phaeobacter inhibens TaxID=221822 RepID=UPI000C9D06E5|nr:hypothetical protein [Phaeobacter inhibens]AUR22508.1 Domain protein of unknown function [Phaeobacter inhibens]
MIYFEHEILTFGTGTKKEVNAMATSLKEWGAAGYEVVSVVPIQIGGAVVTVFLKRKVFIEDQDEGKAA